MGTTTLLLAGAIPVFILTMVWEAWFIHKKAPERLANAQGYTWRDTFASLSMGIGYLTISSVWKIALLPAYIWLYQMRLFDIPTSGAWVWVALFLTQDFMFYWYHRMHHQIRFFWSAHVNHHSSQHYNLSTALRQSWTAPFTSVPFFAPIVLLGFDPMMLVTVELLNLFYQYWIHTETVGRLGFLEKIFMTASHHRVHHGSNKPYLDRNYGGLLIIWDRMFGTFEPESKPVEFGLTKNINTFNPVRIAFHEWVHMLGDVSRATSLRNAWGFVVKKPGWDPKRDARPEQPSRRAA